MKKYIFFAKTNKCITMFQHLKNGQVPKRSNGADCKSAGNAFGGSNPSLPTILHFAMKTSEAMFEQEMVVCPSKLFERSRAKLRMASHKKIDWLRTPFCGAKGFGHVLHFEQSDKMIEHALSKQRECDTKWRESLLFSSHTFITKSMQKFWVQPIFPYILLDYFLLRGNLSGKVVAPKPPSVSI